MDRRSFLKAFGAGAAALAVVPALADDKKTSSSVTSMSKSGNKLLIAHRGASAYAPENTLAAYELAIKQGSDLVEQDLQITKDGVLICMHDMVLETTTDAEQVFPDRFTMKDEKGKKVKHWMIHDFTLAEIKQLKTHSRSGTNFPPTTIPTWQEAIDTIRGKAGLCPETKGSSVYGGLGFDMEKLVGDVLKKNGLNKAKAGSDTPILMQSFYRDSLLSLKKNDVEHPMLWLRNSKLDFNMERLAIAKKSGFSAIGPYKDMVTKESVKQAHQMGLQVVPYTYSTDNLDKKYTDLTSEMSHALYELGVDGMFTNNPDKFPRQPVGASKVKTGAV